jgi:succinyl-CoA synthetase beta subunit
MQKKKMIFVINIMITLLGDHNVQAILVNIFGGIMQCDVITAGIINATTVIGLTKPVVIRLQGTNVGAAKSMIEGCRFRIILADDLEDAAEKAVGVAEIAKRAAHLLIGVKVIGLQL